MTLREAFIECVNEGIYPGPTALNKKRERKANLNRLNGRDAAERINLMIEFEIPYQRNSPYGRKGDIPNKDIYIRYPAPLRLTITI